MLRHRKAEGNAFKIAIEPKSAGVPEQRVQLFSQPAPLNGVQSPPTVLENRQPIDEIPQPHVDRLGSLEPILNIPDKQEG